MSQACITPAGSNPRSVRRVALLVAALLAPASVIVAQPNPNPVFDAKGFSRTRELISDLPFEHVDPLTGNLLLTFTDLELPGNAGFSLKIQRTYNTKVYASYASGGSYLLGEQGAMGLGWTMHMGRLLNANGTSYPVVEMADGSRHPSFPHMDTTSSTRFMTRDLWVVEKFAAPCDLGQCPVMKLPNGVRYEFGYGNFTSGEFWVTRILDPFGNEVRVSYLDTPAQAGLVESVEQRLAGGQTRAVLFAYQDAPASSASPKRLATMTLAQGGVTRTWTYTHVAAVGNVANLLTQVQPPAGAQWTFEYYAAQWPGPHLLKKLTTPNGGTINYVYDDQVFYYAGAPVYSPVVTSRATGGRDISAGTWNFAYSQGSPGWNMPVVTTVTSPVVTQPDGSTGSCRQEVYETWAIGESGNEMPWRIGALKSKSVRDGAGNVLQSESFAWLPSDPISNEPESGNSLQTHFPLLSQRVVVRGSRTYTTANTYDSRTYNSGSNRNFNDYGRPETTTESGELGRTTTRVFYYPPGGDPSRATWYLADKVGSETVAAGGESYVRSWAYNASDGFMTSETTYGITTTYGPDTGGNVAWRKDARGNQTSFVWSWGVAKLTQTPGYAISRNVLSDSTIQSETRRGYTARFEYDLLFRMKKLSPPSGNPTQWSYAVDGSSVTVSRGASSTVTNLDGFGRTYHTSNAVGVQSDVSYDACGRAFQASAPHDGTAVWTKYSYDALGRARQRKNPDASVVTYTYGTNGSGQTLQIKDEENRFTDQLWQAFGDPDSPRLVQVVDGGSGLGGARSTTTYEYNGPGGLKSVSLPGSVVRSWSYYPNTDRLQKESQPELDPIGGQPSNGDVSYEYYANGWLWKRTDAQFGTTTFSYDGNGRLEQIDRPGTYPDTGLRWDASDNRTLLIRGGVRSDFTYDGNNRMVERKDTLEGRQFVTGYGYDDNDWLRHVAYPSGTNAWYSRDNEGRILEVTRDQAGTQPYASGFLYHPSGGVRSYSSGNGVSNTVSYHPQRYWITGAGSGAVTSIGYGHDLVGNVTSTTDSRLGSYTYGYDAVDRLKTATLTSGSGWGNGSYVYDPLGNRTTKTVAGTTTTYGYDTGTQRLTTATVNSVQTAYAHDKAGNVTGEGADVFTYDADNMMTSATVTVAGNTSTTTYAYDGDSLRARKRRGADTSYYLHGPGGVLLSEWLKQGSALRPVRDYVYAGSRLLASVRPPVLSLSPSQINFAYVLGAVTPATQPLQVTSAGQALAYTVGDSAAWLTATPPGTTPGTVNVGVDPAGLQVGLYEGLVTVSSAAAVNSPQTATVRLAVVPEPGLVALPRPLRFVAQEGDTDSVPQDLFVLYAGDPSAVAWTATTSTPWVQMASLTGTTPSQIAVTANLAGLARGTHHGWITVTRDGTSESKIIPVELTIQPGPGASCDGTAWYCESFDGFDSAPLDGQGGATGTWEAQGLLSAQVAPDPRGMGRALLMDPPTIEEGTSIDSIDPLVGAAAGHPIQGTQISAQVMTAAVGPDSPQVAKLEFLTQAGVAWGKTGRTYGAFRFGSKLYLQFGPNIYKVLVDQMEPDRWYDVRVTYEQNKIYAYVDGQQRFVTTNPLAGGAYATEAFSVSAWDRPGQAHLDFIEARSLQSGLVVEPTPVRVTKPSAGLTSPGAKRGLSGAPDRKGEGQPTTAKRLPAVPLAFEALPGGEGYAGHGLGYSLRADGAGLKLRAHKAGGDSELGIRFGGANAAPSLKGTEPLPTKLNYLVVGDRSRSRTGVPLYSRLQYGDVYPGVSLVLYGSGRQLEYDFVVAPGANPERIRLAFEGAESVRVDEGGDLLVATRSGELRQRAALVYQERDGRREPVAARYVQVGPREVRFAVAEYDASRPLVLDPVLVFSTYLGGAAGDELLGLAIDSDGSAYVAGTMYPVDNSDAQTIVAKFNPSGTILEYLTYITLMEPGGAIEGRGVAVEAAGRAVVVAKTTVDTRAGSALGPPAPRRAVPGAATSWQRGGAETVPGRQAQALAVDAIVMRLSLSGSGIEDYVYLAGDGYDEATAVTIDGQGNIVVAGVTGSTNFPVVQPLSLGPWSGATLHGTHDAFVSMINPADFSILRSSYLGGSALEQDVDVAVDRGSGSLPGSEAPPAVYVAGVTTSSDFPTTPGALKGTFTPTDRDVSDLFVARLYPGGVATIGSSTYLGGSSNPSDPNHNGREEAPSVVVDNLRTVHLATWTDNRDWPSVLPGWQNDRVRGVVTGLGDGLASSKYLKELDWARLSDIDINSQGYLAVSGSTWMSDSSFNFPQVYPVQFTGSPGGGGPYPLQGSDQAILAKLRPNTVAQAGCTDPALPECWIVHSSILGSATETSYAAATAVAIGETGEVYLAGHTTFTEFITQDPIQPAIGSLDGRPDGFVLRISDADLPQGGAVFEFSQAVYETSEEGVPSATNPSQPVAVITVVRSGDTSIAASVRYGMLDGTATSPGDFEQVSEVLEFAPGEVIKTFEVPLVDDDLAEPNETVNLNLTRAINGSLGPIARAVLTIEDNDGLVRKVKIRDRVLAAGPNWTIEENIPWLVFTCGQASPCSTTPTGLQGTGPSEVVATGVPGTLPPGTYSEYFVVTGDTGASPQVVEAILKVLQ